MQVNILVSECWIGGAHGGAERFGLVRAGTYLPMNSTPG
jgi:hypothetical protein